MRLRKVIRHPQKGCLTCDLLGAEDGIRTRDPHLGKAVSWVGSSAFPYRKHVACFVKKLESPAALDARAKRQNYSPVD